MLFCSNFNGTWDQYIDAFSDGIPLGLDFFWYSTTNYPRSISITPFKDFIRENQVDTNYYYNSVPGVAQWDVKAALRVRRTVLGTRRPACQADAGRFSDGLCRSGSEGAKRFRLSWLRARRERRHQERRQESQKIHRRKPLGLKRRKSPISLRKKGEIMPNFDMGAYFLTVLCPVSTTTLPDDKAAKGVAPARTGTSPVHALREQLARLAPAQQDPRERRRQGEKPFRLSQRASISHASSSLTTPCMSAARPMMRSSRS